MLIRDIMTKNVITVSPETGVHALAELFVTKNVSGAPVIDRDGNLLGIVKEEGVIFQDKNVHLPTFINLSIGFLTLGVKRFEDEIKKITASKVLDIMETACLTINSGVKVEDAATMMIEKDSYYLPVVDSGKLVGVVTKKDIVRAISGLKG